MLGSPGGAISPGHDPRYPPRPAATITEMKNQSNTLPVDQEALSPSPATPEPPAPEAAALLPEEVARLKRYQDEIARASVALHRAQPDLMACEDTSALEPQLRRSRWPFIVAIWTSIFVWLSIAWTIKTIM
jgi:hypothetical protein